MSEAPCVVQEARFSASPSPNVNPPKEPDVGLRHLSIHEMCTREYTDREVLLAFLQRTVDAATEDAITFVLEALVVSSLFVFIGILYAVAQPAPHRYLMLPSPVLAILLIGRGSKPLMILANTFSMLGIVACLVTVIIDAVLLASADVNDGASFLWRLMLSFLTLAVSSIPFFFIARVYKAIASPEVEHHPTVRSVHLQSGSSLVVSDRELRRVAKWAVIQPHDPASPTSAFVLKEVDDSLPVLSLENNVLGFVASPFAPEPPSHVLRAAADVAAGDYVSAPSGDKGDGRRGRIVNRGRRKARVAENATNVASTAISPPDTLMSPF